MAVAATEHRLEEAMLKDVELLGHSGFGGDPEARDDYRDFRQSLKEQLYGAAPTTRTNGPSKQKSSAKRQPVTPARKASPTKRGRSAPVTPPDPSTSSKSPDLQLNRLLEQIGRARRENKYARVLGLCGTAISILDHVQRRRADKVRPIIKAHMAWAKANMNADNAKKLFIRRG
ncbi:hypothetical protein GCM10009677_32840 [Sphaerisporangium rubeum]